MLLSGFDLPGAGAGIAAGAGGRPGCQTGSATHFWLMRNFLSSALGQVFFSAGIATPPLPRPRQAESRGARAAPAPAPSLPAPPARVFPGARHNQNSHHPSCCESQTPRSDARTRALLWSRGGWAEPGEGSVPSRGSSAATACCAPWSQLSRPCSGNHSSG